MVGKIIRGKFGTSLSAVERGEGIDDEERGRREREEEIGGVEKIRRRGRKKEEEEPKKKKEKRKVRETTWRPFAEAPALASYREEKRRRDEEARLEEQKRKEREEKERVKRIAEFYTNFEKAYLAGKLTKDDIEKFLSDYRIFPKGAYVACQELLADIASGKIEKKEPEEFKREVKERKIVIRGKPVKIEEILGKKGAEVSRGSVILDSLIEKELIESGTKEIAIPEIFKIISRTTRTETRFLPTMVDWTKDDWYNFLLDQYLKGRFCDVPCTKPAFRIEEFVEDYSPEAFIAGKEFLEDIEEQEKEKKRLAAGEPQKEKFKPLSDKEIDEVILGVREYLQGLPIEEGKPILERLQKVQINEFKQILRETISQEDLDKRTSEIEEREKISREEAEKKAEKELAAEAARKILAERELIVHGFWEYDKEKKAWGVKHYSDLDGRSAMALLKKAGITSKGKYVPQGDWERGAVNADTGFRDGFLVEFDEETVRRLDKEMENLYNELDQRKQEIRELEQRVASGEEEAKELLDIKKDLIEGLKSKIYRRERERWAVGLLTIFFDHHGPYSDKETSATKVVYETLCELGLLKFRDDKERQAYEAMVDFVTRMDNFNSPDLKKYMAKTLAEMKDRDPKVRDRAGRRMLDLYRFISPEKLLQFFQDGKKPTDVLSDGELRKYGLIYEVERINKATGKKEKVTINRLIEKRKTLAKREKDIDELRRTGWVILAEGGETYLCDIKNRLMGGDAQLIAEAKGLTGIINYNPETHGFFVARSQGEFNPKIFEDLPQGKLIRGSMFLHPPGREKLQVTLGDLIERLRSPKWKPAPGSELGRFLEREQRRVKTVVTKTQAGWYGARAPDGLPIIVKGLPKDFKSGQEALLRLTQKPQKATEDEMKQREFPEEYYIGHWESEEIPLPKEVKAPPAKVEVRPKTPEERRKEAILSVIESTIKKEMARRRSEMERSPVWGKPEKAAQREKMLKEIESGLRKYFRERYKV